MEYLDQLRNDIRNMDRHSPLYKALKEELEALGYWRKLPRGNPRRGYQAMINRVTYD